MQVRIFNRESCLELEKAINEFLNDADRFGTKVVDIKFSGNGRGHYSSACWSAMIIME